MLKEDLKLRVKRLMSGDHRTLDLDRLFLGLRERAGQSKSFKVVGDFVAHRDVRDQGVTTALGKDVFTSVDVWSMKMRKLEPSISDFIRAAEANLRIATDKQIKAGCGCQRGRAKKQLKSVIKKIDAQESLSDAEMKIFQYLGNSFIWRPAITSDQLLLEVKEVLVRTGLLAKSDRDRLDDIKNFLSLYVLAVMHGSAIQPKGDQQAKLFAGYANRYRLLELKVDITFKDLETDLITPVCLFLTDLKPDGHCDVGLLFSDDPVMFNHWDFPLEVGDDGKLQRMIG